MNFLAKREKKLWMIHFYNEKVKLYQFNQIYQTYFNREENKNFDDCSFDDEEEDKKFFNVKTKQIQWNNINFINNLGHDAKSFLHIYTDITKSEQLKAEKTMRKYQRLMLSSVAHEFRNPLNAINGNLQLIQMQEIAKIENDDPSAISMVDRL